MASNSKSLTQVKGEWPEYVDVKLEIADDEPSNPDPSSETVTKHSADSCSKKADIPENAIEVQKEWLGDAVMEDDIDVEDQRVTSPTFVVFPSLRQTKNIKTPTETGPIRAAGRMHTKTNQPSDFLEHRLIEMESSQVSQESGTGGKRKMVRFSVGNDNLLLTQVISHNPYEVPARWGGIAERLSSHTSKNFSSRCCKDRVDHLLKLFLKGEREILKKSGTEEEYAQRERLLKEINCLKQRTLLTRKRVRVEAEKEDGKRTRLEGAATLLLVNTEKTEQKDEERVTCGDSEDYVDPTESVSSVHAGAFETWPICTADSDSYPSSSSSSSVNEEVTDTVVTHTNKVTVQSPNRKRKEPLPPPAHPAAAVATVSQAPWVANGEKKAEINRSAMDQVHWKREADLKVTLKTLEVEKLKAENESRRLALEESKFQMVIENHRQLSQRYSEFDKKVDNVLEIQRQLLAMVEHIYKSKLPTD